MKNHRMNALAATALLGLALPAIARADSGSLTWRGIVDDVTRIEIRGRSVRNRTVSGREPERVSSRVNGSALDRGGDLKLETLRGRTDPRIVQYPDRRNDYTTIVEIRDRPAGDSPYEFRLSWDDNGRGRDRDRDDYDRRRPSANDRIAYQRGYEQGRRDYERRERREYGRYRSQFDFRSENDFRRGYEEGYDTARDRRRP